MRARFHLGPDDGIEEDSSRDEFPGPRGSGGGTGARGPDKPMPSRVADLEAEKLRGLRGCRWCTVSVSDGSLEPKGATTDWLESEVE